MICMFGSAWPFFVGPDAYVKEGGCYVGHVRDELWQQGSVPFPTIWNKGRSQIDRKSNMLPGAISFQKLPNSGHQDVLNFVSVLGVSRRELVVTRVYGGIYCVGSAERGPTDPCESLLFSHG